MRIKSPAYPAWPRAPPRAKLPDMLEDDPFPTSEEIEETVTRALRRYGFAPAEHLPSPSLGGAPHPFAAAGPRLRDLREKSGWTISEIAERTGVHLDVLIAFEDGDTAASAELTRFDLERLASACCGSMAELLGSEHPFARSSSDFTDWGSSGCSMDPCG